MLFPTFRRLAPPALLAAGLLSTLPGCSSSSGSAQAPPKLPPELRARAAQFDLVDVRDLEPGIVVDLLYATPQNVTGRTLYPRGMPCLLRYRTALKLQHAQKILNAKGYGLKVWDAWRPPELQRTLVREAPDPDLFLDPDSYWSMHCGGVAVDVTLVDRRGVEQPMPTGHDESSDHTGYHYKGGDSRIAANLYLLQTAMVEAGFQILPTEWWHFDDSFYLQHPAPIVYARQLGIPIPE